MNINSMIPPPSSPAVDQNGFLAAEWWKFLLTLLSRTGGPGMHPDTQDSAEQAAMNALANVNTGAITAQQALAVLSGLEPLPVAPIFPLGRLTDLEMPDRFWLDASLQARIADIESGDRLSSVDASTSRIVSLEGQDQPGPDLRLAARVAVLEDAEWLTRMDSQLSQKLAELAQKLADLDAMLMEWHPAVQPAPFVLPSVDGWAAPALLSSWVNFSASYNPAGYFKDPWGVVHLRGVLRSGTVGASSFTLPAGYRPANIEKLATVSNGAMGTIEIYPSGDLTLIAGSNVYFSLDALTFRAV